MKKALQSDLGSFVTADPFRCRIWEFNDRIEEYVTEDSCRAEIASVARDGQLVPVVGRLLKDDPEFDIEIIYGARRLFVARHLKVSIRVEIRDLSNRQAAVAIETENCLRKQTSPYERGMWLAKLLRQGIYQSRDEMAKDLRISPTQVTRLLKFAQLPALVIAAFPSPHDILESWAVELHKAWTDEHRRRLLTDRCRSLGATSPPPPAASAYETLVACPSSGGRSRPRSKRRIVKTPDGATVFRFERQRKDVVIRIPNALVDAIIEKELTQVIAAVLSRQPTFIGPGRSPFRTTAVIRKTPSGSPIQTQLPETSPSRSAGSGDRECTAYSS